MLGIYSFGGFGREIHRFAEDELRAGPLVFIDDAPPSETYGFEVLSLDEFEDRGGSRVINAFADPKLRSDKADQLTARGIETVELLQHPESEIGDRVTFGTGLVMTRGSQITSDAKLGKNVQMNLLSYIAHDCEIGDSVTLSPRASINGRVTIEDRVYVGAGAIVLPGKQGKQMVIGEGAVIGAGAVVTRDVAAGATVVGSPAKEIGSN